MAIPLRIPAVFINKRVLNMSSGEVGKLVLALSVLIFFIHVMGYLFDKLKQPRLVGEILSGVVLGPFVFGKIFPSVFEQVFGIGSATVNKTEIVLNVFNWIGLFLLMFISGSETRRLMAKENHRQTAWLLGLGTPLPFFLVLGLGLNGFLPLKNLVGKSGQEMSALLVLAVAVAVTSIPVISRIFYDLKILHTRFASLILGSAVLEDIILWGVLAVATGIAATGTLAQEHIVKNITAHVLATFLYMGVGLTAAPRVLKYLHNCSWNILIKSSQVGYLFFILFLYTSLAALFEVNLVFASFLAGFGLVGGINGSERQRFSDSLDSIAKVSSALFIPLYFSIVGFKLVFGREFSPVMLVTFLLASSCLSLVAVGLASWMAGFRKLDILNLAITTNARGGPGIVLASVAFEAGIINAQFYTTLVMTAILTSQAAGLWLRFVLSRGWPLLSSNPQETWSKVGPPQLNSHV